MFFDRNTVNLRFMPTRSAVVIIFIMSTLMFFTNTQAQVSKHEPPMIGAEIFIEPGQRPEDIDTWFKRLHEAGMTITRIRLFENYMRDPAGNWDFSLFDHAFRAGERYGIAIYGNLFPATSFDDIGGFKFPRDEDHLTEIAEYIRQVVQHFSRYKSLYGWVPINEPGVGGYLDKQPLTTKKFGEWKAANPQQTRNEAGFMHFDFAEEKFLLHYNSWFLDWLAQEIRSYDPERPIHVNNHNVFDNVAEYDFPAWRHFLTSLGASAHASWHFRYYAREHYALAVDATSEIIRSGAGDIPWMMTELQGGNNTYSGYDAMCPTAEEISQWLWITTGAEAKGSIFWCLNPRASGIEAGEWALLDFQQQPSDRLIAASSVANTLKQHEDLFAEAKAVTSGIHLLYARESLWVEKKLLNGIKDQTLEARTSGAVMKSVLAYHQALAENGIQASIQEFSEFDFSAADFTNKAIILAHQVAIPSAYWPSIARFVEHGGKLIVEGLSGYYNEHAICTWCTTPPWTTLFGAAVSEVKVVDRLFQLALNTGGRPLPAHAWQGLLKPTTAQVIAHTGNTASGIRHTFGRGQVVWLPAPLGLGARVAQDYAPLADWLTTELPLEGTIRFAAPQPGLLMKTMESNGQLISIVVNKHTDVQVPSIVGLPSGRQGEIIYRNNGAVLHGQSLTIHPEETVVVVWGL